MSANEPRLRRRPSFLNWVKQGARRVKVATPGVRDRLRRQRGSETSLFTAVTRVVLGAVVILALLVPLVRWYTTGEWRWLPEPTSESPGSIEVLKLAATLVAGLGGIVALTVAYRKQREQEVRRDSVRFDAAAQQLGSDDGAIRLAGVYAATALADESDRLRSAVVQLLCAYLRLNRGDDGPVQQTILEAIASRTAATSDSSSWSTYDLDLHGVVISDRLSWSGCKFDGRVNFEGARFEHEVQFVVSRFRGPLILSNAQFNREWMLFYGTFSDTVLLNGASFAGPVNAIDATFAGGLQASSTEFKRGAIFSKSRFPNGAVFSGAKFSSAWFDNCVFARGADGQQTSAVHNGDAHFRDARFSGEASFDGATFLSKGLFDSAHFEVSPHFESANFADGGSIDGAQFPGEIPVALRSFGRSGKGKKRG